MARTKAADTKGRETNSKRRESDRKARGQTMKIIKGILGETGEDRMYEAKGKEQRKKGKEYQDQDNGGNNGRYSYPLVVPRLGEAPDNSTVVQCTGTDRSTVHHHDTMDNPPIPSNWKAETGPKETSNTNGTPGTTPTTYHTP